MARTTRVSALAIAFDVAVVAGVVGAVMVAYLHLDAYLLHAPPEGQLIQSPPLRLVRLWYQALWLVLSPLGYYALQFSRSLRRDLARWRS